MSEANQQASMPSPGDTHKCSIPTEQVEPPPQSNRGAQKHSTLTGIDATQANGALKHSVLTEQVEPSSQLTDGAQKHSITTGFDAVHQPQAETQESDQTPWSPTKIDPEL